MLHSVIPCGGAVSVLLPNSPTSVMAGDSILDKFRRGAQKASIQATAFVMDSSSKVANGSRDFVQGFSLPAEAEKAANILQSFLGVPPFKTCDERVF